MVLSLEDVRRAIIVECDDYRDTVFAIIGFSCLYTYDSMTQSHRQDVRLFQGRQLAPALDESQVPNAMLCPDLGIVIADRLGILAEVKKNFPSQDGRRREEIFDQLHSYDQPLLGWPTVTETLAEHEIALLVHQTTSRWAVEYYRKRLSEGFQLSHRFAVVEFNRAPQADHYFFFRREEGIITEPTPARNNRTLMTGIPVPMRYLVTPYSTAQLYDSEPPLLLILHLIYTSVLTDIASMDPKFSQLRRKQKLDIDVDLDDIADRLREGFSFQSWHTMYPSRQPKIPPHSWVEKACEAFVDMGEAEWLADAANSRTRLKFHYRRYDDSWQHYLGRIATMRYEQETQPRQLSLIKEDGFTGSL